MSISCICMADRPSVRAAQHGEAPNLGQDQTPWQRVKRVERGGARLSPTPEMHLVHGAPTKRPTTLVEASCMGWR
eukprot:364013-Chlamydomonas_euryale.AAC.17